MPCEWQKAQIERFDVRIGGRPANRHHATPTTSAGGAARDTTRLYLMQLANLLLGRTPGGRSRGRPIGFARMETISFEERQNDATVTHSSTNNSNNNSLRRVPTLRDSFRISSNNSSRIVSGPMQRFFPLLCVAQTIFIGLILFYRSSGPAPLDTRLSADAQQQATSKYRVYSDGSAKKAKLLLGSVAGCDQRKHDLRFGSVTCASSGAQFGCRVLNGNHTKPLWLLDENDHNKEGANQVWQAHIVTTSKAGKRLHGKWAPMVEWEQDCSSSACQTDARTKILINPSVEKQSIIGWGGALTDSSINNILSLSTNGTTRLLEEYFGPDGLQFSIVRITIGGSDFSSRFYTNNDKRNPEEPDDLAMKNFRLEPEDTLYKIPILKYIQDNYSKRLNQSGGAIKLFASMWSPPTWMKTNNHFNKGHLKGSISMKKWTNTTTTDERYYKALAELKKKFILAYSEKSIHFWGLTVMNEPVFAVQPFLDFNTMIFPKHDYASYVAKYLGPMLRSTPELRHIKLIAHDDNRRFLLDFTEPTLTSDASGRYIDGVSVHGYADKDYHQMETIYELNQRKNLFVLPTELCSGHLPWMLKALAGNWHRGVHYALDILHSLQHSAAGWVDWNMALDMEGGPGWLGGRLDSPVLVDKTRDLYHKSPMFYVLGHFSRYISTGSVRVESQLINGVYNFPLETVTFKLPAPSKLLVTVILNSNPHPVAIHLKLVSSWSRLYKVECEPDSITTIRYVNKAELTT